MSIEQADPAKWASELVREQAGENLKRAMQYRADVKSQREYAKDCIAHYQGELVKSERLLERMEAALPDAEEGVREAFDFFRYSIERSER